MPSILEHNEQYGMDKTLPWIPKVDPHSIDANDLLAFLLKILEDYPNMLESNSPLRSCYRKWVAIWDWLQYHESAMKNWDVLKSIG